MSPPSRHIQNAATGDRIVFIQSPLLDDGDMLVLRCFLPPCADGAPLHMHDEMTETFAVEYGALEIDLGNGVIHRLHAGEAMTIEPGTPHGFRNPLETETCFVTTANPGTGLETFLRTVYRLGSEGAGRPGPLLRSGLEFASMMRRTDMVLSSLPRWFQRACWSLAQSIARLLAVGSHAADGTRAQESVR